MKRSIIVGLICFWSMSVLPARGASVQPERGGTITLATQNDLVTMNPMVRTASTERLTRMLMFDSLLASVLQGKVQPNLAESWETSSDGKVYTFRLRKGVMFHHGRELSSLAGIRSFPVIPSGSLEAGPMKPTQFPPGTGAFRFVEWLPAQRVMFQRFENHWGHKAYVDRLVIRPIADTTVRFTALQAGDVDIVERTPYEWMKQKEIDALLARAAG